MPEKDFDKLVPGDLLFFFGKTGTGLLKNVVIQMLGDVEGNNEFIPFAEECIYAVWNKNAQIMTNII